MGAVAIDLELDSLEGSGGYAREMTEDRAELQRERLTPYIAAADALITTAAVPGRAAPKLVTAAMVEQKFGTKYKYFTNRLNVVKHEGTTVYATVQIWNDQEAREVPVQWRR